jgi:hypothetical protein
MASGDNLPARAENKSLRGLFCFDDRTALALGREFKTASDV